MSKKWQKVDLKMLLANGKIEDTIATLLEVYKDEDELDAVVHCASRYREIKDAKGKELLSFDDYNKMMNKIRSTLLDLINDIDEQESSPANPGRKLVEIEYKRSITRVKIITQLRDQSEGLTIKALHELCELKHRKYLIDVLNELIALDLLERYRQENKSLNRLTDKGRKMIERLL